MVPLEMTNCRPLPPFQTAFVPFGTLFWQIVPNGTGQKGHKNNYACNYYVFKNGTGCAAYPVKQGYTLSMCPKRDTLTKAPGGYMSKDSVERLLGRPLTDARFRDDAAGSLERPWARDKSCREIRPSCRAICQVFTTRLSGFHYTLCQVFTTDKQVFF